MTDTQTPDSLRPGDVVGPWLIEGYAGRGAYGAVYRARRADRAGSGPVALKVAVFPSDPRFSREVALLSRHQHPGIPRLLDWGWWHLSAEVAHPYIAMEWIRGRPMYEWGRVHNPTCREVLRVLAQAAWALEELHRGGCLHRDVKGDNLLVEPGGRVVLTDFGSGTWKGAPPLTRRMLPPNTREYRSPESLLFEWEHWETKGACYETRPADDLYALGVTAYRLVTGVYPPPGTAPEALKAQLQEPPPRRWRVRELNRRVVPELAALIERLLEREPEARGPAREVALAAESAAEHAGPEAQVPFLDLERPGVAATQRDRRDARAWEWGRVLVASAMSLVVVAPCCMASAPSGTNPSEPARAEVPGAEMAPDAGTKGLGDEAVTTRVEASEAPVTLKAVSREMPKQPLPGQRRPPCRQSWEEAINGGCWRRLAKNAPPCGDETYEWQGACYDPSWERTRPPTSTNPE